MTQGSGSQRRYSSNEAPHDLAPGETFFGASLDIGAGAGVVVHAAERHDVQRPVGLAVPAAVEAVALGLARGGRQWAHPAQRRERPFAASGI